MSADQTDQSHVPLAPRKCRAALALLGWSVRDLGRASGVAPQAIRLWERGIVPLDTGASARVQTCLSEAGIDFREDGTVRLRQGESGVDPTIRTAAGHR